MINSNAPHAGLIRQADHSRRARQVTVVITLLAMQAQWMAPAFAEPYQKPLLSSTANSAMPNFVLTLDNSESMSLSHLPEDFNTVNGQEVRMGGTKIIRMHPDDDLSIGSHSLLTWIAGYVPGTVSGNCADVYECQMRSPDVNFAYYNPKVRYLPWRNPGQPSTSMPNASFTAAYVDPKAQTTSSSVVDLSVISRNVSTTWCTSASDCDDGTRSFNPAIFYQLVSETADPRQRASYLKRDLITWSESVMPWGQFTYSGRTDCPATGACTLEQERANFANWFTYHRSRILFTKGAVSEAFASLGNNLRLGWGPLNTTAGDAVVSGPTYGVREFSSVEKSAFLNWLQDTQLTGSTPLRYATTGVGRYFQRTGADSPWRSQPGQSGSPILGCRRAGHILTTDGYYNDDGGRGGNYPGSDLAVGDVDNEAPPSSPNYTPAPPYQDSNNSNSLADIAMKFWANPLVSDSLFSDTSDRVKPTDKDPATWLHLNQYMVGLGVRSSVNQDTVHSTMTSATSWPLIPTTPDNTDSAKIDDMIHAAVNSRGRFFSVSDGTGLQSAIASAVELGSPSTRTEAGLATQGLSAIAGDKIYVPEYNAGGWFGDIKAKVITSDARGGSVDVWSARERLPSHGARNVVTYAGGTTRGIAFNRAALTSASLLTTFPAAMRTDNARADAFINYIRGDESGAGNADGQFRARTGVLPDFVNSQPEIIQGNLDMGYTASGLPSGGGALYKDYLDAKKTRSPLLFIGGNGGMLHAFDAAVSTLDSTVGGAEVFAYVPREALSKLHLLASQNYDHQFFVDGPLNEVDAFIAPPGRSTIGWTNMLIGSMGAGGKSVFAIDVTGTARSGGSASIGASNVLWEISSANSDDIGYVNSRVQVGYVQGSGVATATSTSSPGWYAFIGNGQNSRNGHAALIVVDLNTGQIAATIKPGATTNSQMSENGLTGVDLIYNARKEVIGAYAGDLHGRVWRFEFEGNDPADATKWKVGFGDKPLFVARNSTGVTQMISAAPSHYVMPARSNTTGNLVVFGTGRLFESGDALDTSTQTIYAVLDDTVGTSSATTSAFEEASPTFNGRSLLQAQAILAKSTDTSNDLLQTSSNAVVYSGEAKKLGWYMDLMIDQSKIQGATGTFTDQPKVIYQPQVISSVVYIPTIVPPDQTEGCSARTGKSYSFVLPVVDGAQVTIPTFDTNGDGLINESDKVGQGFVSDQADGDDRIRNTNDARIKVARDTNRGRRFRIPSPPEDPTVQRRSLNDRVWKRIVNPPVFPVR